MQGRIPLPVISSLRNYLKHGISPGSGIRAVLEGDLFQAARRLDNDSWASLRDLVQFAHHYMPVSSYGDSRLVREWLDNEQLRKESSYQISESLRELDRIEEETTGSPRKEAISQ